ncbi:hypothetical protein BH23ACT9_BH23ACT9_31450 [soil metagenome]
MLDGAKEVEIWTRLHRGELVIAWQHRRYNPDFYAIVGGDHYLLEVKSDRHADDPDVQARAQAVEEWARYVVDHGDHGNWQYLLIPERTLKTARTMSAMLTQAANR